MPRDLRELMRHESTETTMRYCIGQNAATTAAVLWDAYDRRVGTGLGTRLGTPASETATEDAQSTPPKSRRPK